jgi:predicted nucleotidyltransferase
MSFDWSTYTGNLRWLRNCTIYITRHGSHAYGTDLPTSDVDLRGIFIAPKEYYMGFMKKQETEQQKVPDLALFELRKFMFLAAECNPNALELLFTDETDHLITSTYFNTLRIYRNQFLSTKAKHTFSGYAISQLKRINVHYRWLKNPPKRQPTRTEFGLPERTVIPADQLEAAQAAIRKQLEQWNWHDLSSLDEAQRIAVQSQFERVLFEITQWDWREKEDRTWRAAANTIGFDTNFIELLDKERRYTSKLREWRSYMTWKEERNEARAQLEAEYGYDTKHGMHLVRLMRMCREILELGEVIVRRPDRDELLSIRAGAWSYERLIGWATEQDLLLTELAKKSTLPRQVSREALDDICVSLATDFHNYRRSPK